MSKKMNRKAYTLIEILAAVVILGILLLIAVPAINKQLNKFRDEYYEKLEKSVKSAGQDYIAEKRYAKPNQLLYSKVVKVEDLEQDGFIDEVKDYLGEKCDTTDTSYSYVVVVKTGEKKYQYRSCLKCSEDDYFTDTTGEANDLCNEAWLENTNISYNNGGDFNEDEFLYVYYGTSESYIKNQVGLEYNVVKKDYYNRVLAEVGNNTVVYPDNINELVGKNVNTIVTLKYELPDGTQLNKKAVVYKHGAPKITMTYLNGKTIDGSTVKAAGSAYTSGEWSNGVKVRIDFNTEDVQDVINQVTMKTVQYYDINTKNWTTICSNNNKDYCVWEVNSNFNKTIKFRITNSNGHNSEITGEYTIKVDKSTPTCGTLVQNSSWTNVAKTVSVGCNDTGGSTCNRATYSVTYPQTGIPNKTTTSINIYDTAGNSRACSLNVYVDTTKPSSCTMVMKDANNNTISSGSTATSDVTFNITGVDNETDKSGMKTTYAVISGSQYNNTNSLGNGTYTVTPTCVDNAGNVTTGTAVTLKLNKTVSLTFNANGGSGTMTAQDCQYNVNCTIKANTFTKTGHSFSGWATTATGAKVYNDKGTIKITTATTLYAKWTADTYTLTYDSQSGTACNSKTGTYGSTWGDLCQPTRTGYTFGGWYTGTNGTGTKVESTSTISGNLKVYAKWTNATYAINYYLNDGKNHDSNPKTYTYGTGVTSFYDPTRSCYTFGGWYQESSLTNKITSISTTATGAKNLYAKWTQKSYSVKYDANGGTGAPSAQTKYCGTTLTLSSTVPTRTGYTFAGWNTKADASGTSYAKGASYTANSGTTLYAKWTKNNYTLSFDANGGTGACSAKTLAYGDAYGDLCTPSRTNHKFDGWYTAASGGTKVSTTTTIGAGNVTLYAHWTAITCSASGHTGDYVTSAKVTCTCTNGNSKSETYTSNGNKTISVTDAPGCSFNLTRIGSKPTVTWKGVNTKTSAPWWTCSQWSTSFSQKWWFSISSTTDITTASYLKIYIAGVSTAYYYYPSDARTSGLNMGCAYMKNTEFGFARSSEPDMTAYVCNSIGCSQASN